MRTAAVTDWSTALPGALPPGEIHLWRFPLGAPPTDTNLRSAAERQRLDRSTHAGRKREWLNSRRALRVLLGHYLGRPPASLEFRLSPRGKPFLPNHPLHFNLSHSGRWGLLAVALDFPLGVDLEALRPVHDPLRLAQRVFRPKEQAELAGCTAERRERRFLELWTLMEARQKLTGEGITGHATPDRECHTFSFTPDPTHVAALAWPQNAAPFHSPRFFHFGDGTG
jgi:4'-phosphopantetheinyl transferase